MIAKNTTVQNPESPRKTQWPGSRQPLDNSIIISCDKNRPTKDISIPQAISHIVLLHMPYPNPISFLFDPIDLPPQVQYKSNSENITILLPQQKTLPMQAVCFH